MAKDAVLDAQGASYSGEMTHRLAQWAVRGVVAAACCVIISCTLPRIVVLSDPLTPEEHLNLGVIHERKGETALAVEEFRKASEKLPLAYVYLGNVSFQTGDFNEAERYYRHAIGEDPSLGDAHNNLP